MRSHDYRLTCCDCAEEWIGPVTEDYEVLCPECSSDDIWIGERYEPFRVQSFFSFTIVLMVLECLLR